MQSANSIMIVKHKLTCLLLAALPLFCFAQENSPYSRYGIGNIVPQGNIANRAMGGISAAIADAITVNTVNPAAFANLSNTTLDIGLEYNGRNLRSLNPVGSYKSNNGIISYLQMGLPLLNGNKKAFKNRTSWAMTFGLKPITKINYKIQSASFSANDSVSTLYEGSGGLNEAFIGTALKVKDFSVGITTGYLFGEKDYNSQIGFNNDTLLYQKANYENKTRFGGMFLNVGVQYAANLKNGVLRFGAYSKLKKSYTASRDVSVSTFNFDADGAETTIDSVYSSTSEKGKVQLPATFGGGFSVENSNLLFGADFETTQWDDYRFFGQKDMVKNNWTAKAGVQYFPATVGSKGYFSFVKYRAGVSFGNDYISADGNLPVYSVSVGGAFPLKLKRSFYDLQTSIMNIAFEYGKRGNKSNNITESIYKISVGFSLGDVWFRRQKYD
ncbi:MAG: hypothetical protein ABIP35_12265 [Ginsengibacter sp.]